jgi:hypothetical protein
MSPKILDSLSQYDFCGFELDCKTDAWKAKMKTLIRRSAIFVFVALVVGRVAGAKASKPVPTGWGYVRGEAVEVRSDASPRRPAITKLQRGALVLAFEARSRGAMNWTHVLATDLASLKSALGWVESSRIDLLPLAQFPSDAELFQQLGGPFLDDATSARTEVVRFLVPQGGLERALVCFLGSRLLPYARLQVFRLVQGKFVPGSFLEFAASEMDAGITALEVRDLVGDGHECLITHESAGRDPQSGGTNLVIRRSEGSTLKTLWTAPLELRNLSSYPPQPRILTPPEKNIGAPGTVTTGTVDFRPRGNTREPVWNGKVEFRAFNREKPVDTVSIEKVCAWDGTRFAPLR